jgi:hypothetical protein
MFAAQNPPPSNQRCPGRTGRLDPQQVRDPVWHLHAQVGQVLRAADLVEALQGDPLPAVRVRHHQHGGPGLLPGHHREPVPAAGRLEVLRRQVHVHHAGDVSARAGHVEPEGVPVPLRLLEVAAAAVQGGGTPASRRTASRLVLTIHHASATNITISRTKRTLLCGSSTLTSATVTAVSPANGDAAARSSSQAARCGSLDQKIGPLCPADYLGPGCAKPEADRSVRRVRRPSRPSG